MRILLVEDEPGIADFIRQGLTESAYAVDVAFDGLAGLDYAVSAEYDVLILDIMLPKLNGLDLMAELRRRGNRTPTLMLTARDTVDDRVAGLDAGADDYLVKPFAFAELLARVRSLLRRPPLQSGSVLCVADLELDTVHHQVRRGSNVIDLTHTLHHLTISQSAYHYHRIGRAAYSLRDPFAAHAEEFPLGQLRQIGCRAS